MSEWFGKLPERWSLKRVGTSFSENTTSNIALLSDIPMQFRFGEIVKKRIMEKDDTLLASIRRYVVVQPNDIMVNGLNLNYDFITQRVAIVHEKGCITPAYISLRPNCYINPMFACYLLKAMDGQKILNGLGTGIRLTLSFSELKKTYLPSPPLPEQDQIVRYLDWKVSQINRLINAKKKQIGLLQEQKQAVVNEAVRCTESCKKCKLKNLAVFKSGTNLTSLQIEPAEKYPVYGGNGLRGYYSEYSYSGEYLLIGRQGALCGNVHYVNEKFWPTEHAVTVKPRDHVNITWLYYLLTDMNLNQYSLAAAQPGLSVECVINLPAYFPTLEEQQTIAAYLDQQCTRIDTIIAKFNDEIALLHEYRTRLISDVVTGKLDVRGVAVPEYEAVEEAGDAAEDEPEEMEVEENAD